MDAITVQIAKLELKPGDTLAVMAPDHISMEQATRIKQLMSDALPDGVKCIVLVGGLTPQKVAAEQPKWVGIDLGDPRGDMAAIFEHPARSKIPPPPPPPPLCRMIQEDVRPDHTCPKCHSSMVRKWYIFGRRKCIHPECGYVDGSELPGPSRPPQPHGYHGAHVEPPQPWPR